MWFWPLPEVDWNGWESGWYGAFGAHRRWDRHTGLDVYAAEGSLVHAVEAGTIVTIENFTGPEAESPWWLPTKAILVEGESGIVLYGEIIPNSALKVGDHVDMAKTLGHVTRVIKKDRVFPLVSMLHLELYRHGTRTSTWWKSNEPQPECLLDPTSYLLKSRNLYSTDHYYNFLMKYPDLCREFLWTLYMVENEEDCNKIGYLSQIPPKHIGDYAVKLASASQRWGGKFASQIKWNKAFIRLLRMCRQECPDLIIECFNKVRFSEYLRNNNLWHLYHENTMSNG